jgi:hypothetical protein
MPSYHPVQSEMFRILELVIRVLYLVVHFLYTMQYGIGTQCCITTTRVSRKQALLAFSWWFNVRSVHIVCSLVLEVLPIFSDSMRLLLQPILFF